MTARSQHDLNYSHGCLEYLKRNSPMVLWEGYVVYHWDYGHCATLFNSHPEWDKENEQWILEDGWEVDQALLEALGIKLPIETPDEHNFYEGGKARGMSDIAYPISLDLPRILFEFLFDTILESMEH